MDSITKHTVVTLNYSLLTMEGQRIDGASSFAYLHGSGNLLQGMENALEGKTVGDSVTEILYPKDAFGEKVDHEELRVHRREFGKGYDNLQVGFGLTVQDSKGNDVVLYVEKKKGSYVSLTRNHPLAGVTLQFQAQILGVRCATPDEKEEGRAHGLDGTDKPTSCACC